MDNLKNSEPTTKSKKFNSKQNKLTNKFGTGINDKRNFENIISDINLDLMKINKKLEKHSDYQEHIQSILEEQKREKLALEHQKELEREAEEYKERKKEMDLMNQKMKKEIEEKFMKEIEQRC